MTTKKDDQKEKKAETPLKKSSSLQSQKARSSFSNPIIVILILLTFLALGTASYAVYLTLQVERLTGNLTDSLAVDIEEQAKLFSSFSKSMSNKISNFSTNQAKIETKIQTLDDNLRSTLQQKLYQSNDWMLLKARYYLQLAQINAHWSDNIQATTALLQQADEVLSTMHDQRLFEVRQTIAEEIAEIKSLPQVDTAGLLSQLDAIQNILVKLPLSPPLSAEVQQNKIKPKEKSPAAWRERLKSSINLLERLVVIRRHDENIKPLLSKAQESMLRQSIRFDLQKAQWAVLHNNSAVYQKALNQAISTIEVSFMQKAANTKSVINQLKKLKKVELNQSNVSLEKPLGLLNQLINQKNKPETNSKPMGEHSL